MFSRIVIGVDGSDDGERALSQALDLAREQRAEVVLAHVEETVAGKGGGSLRADDAEFRAATGQRAAELDSAGTPTTFEAASAILGGPARALEEIAERVGADLIVVGSRGHSAPVGVVLGSVAQRLLHVARRPVLVIPARSGL